MVNMSLRNRLYLSFSIPVFFTIILSLFSWFTVSNLNKSVSTVYLDRVIPLNILKNLSDVYAVSIIDAVNKANSGILSSEQALSVIESARSDIESDWQSYLKTSLTDQERDIVDEINEIYRIVDNEIGIVVLFLRANNNGSVRDKLHDFDGALYTNIDPMSEKISELYALQVSEAESEFIRSEEIFSDQMFSLLFLVLISSLLAIVAIIWIVKYVFSVIGCEPEQAVRVMSKFAQGHLNVDVTLDPKDQFSLLYHLNSMAYQLSPVIEEIKTVSALLDKSSEELSKVSSQSNKQLIQQHKEVESVSSSMSQMSASVAEVAANIALTSKRTLDAQSQLQAGQKSIDVTISSINSLAIEISGTTRSIDELSLTSEEIGQVVDVIKGVAGQTNLLALNAAIEAARAGEQGRGFAVVADEVRTLARRTHDSTLSIQKMIERLSDGVSSTVDSMYTSETQAKETINYAVSMQMAFDEINKCVDVLNVMCEQIASAAVQQSTVAEIISKNLQHIKESTSQNEYSSGVVSNSSVELKNLSSRLINNVSFFVVE